MDIANTKFEHSFEEQWTYEKGGDRRQLDFGLVARRKTISATDAHGSDEIGVGLDHRTVSISLKLTGLHSPASGQPKKKATKSMRGWKATCEADYRDALDAKLDFLTDADVSVGKQLQERCAEIEQALLEVADRFRESEAAMKHCRKEAQQHLHALIDQRRISQAARTSTTHA